jgi:alkanesulfonate monooxygenase SsuD/methylene tetrahydromethanopterin reductase-like flavin-dependent oxidoreductase (luciferase family)
VTISFGFGLITCQRYPGDSRSDTDLYAQALELATQADTLGLDSAWVSEHHFVDDSYMPSLLAMCAAMAARTERIKLGTALLLAPLYEPVRLAEDAAVVDLISRGRLILGLGLGWRGEEFEGLGVSLRDRVPRLVNAIVTLRQAWSGEAVTGGSLVTYPDLAAIRRAGALADGFMATEVNPEQFATQVSWAREELRRRPNPPHAFTISLHLPTFVWDGPEAFEIVRDHLRYVDWKYEDMGGARRRTGEPSTPPAITKADEDRLRSASLVGTPDEVAARIHEFHQAAGGDFHFIARAYLPGLDYAVQQRTLELFAVEVVPRVRRLAKRER